MSSTPTDVKTFLRDITIQDKTEGGRVKYQITQTVLFFRSCEEFPSPQKSSCLAPCPDSHKPEQADTGRVFCLVL